MTQALLGAEEQAVVTTGAAVVPRIKNAVLRPVLRIQKRQQSAIVGIRRRGTDRVRRCRKDVALRNALPSGIGITWKVDRRI